MTTAAPRLTASAIVGRLDDLGERLDRLTEAANRDHDALIGLTNFLKGQNLAGRMDELEGRVTVLETHTSRGHGKDDAAARISVQASSWLAVIVSAVMALLSWLGLARGH